VEQDAVAEPEAVALLAVGQSLGLGYRLGQGRDQLVGPAQIVVLDQSIIDVARDDVLGRRVGDRRVERLGGFLERRVDDALGAVGIRVGIIGAAHGKQHRAHEHGAKQHAQQSTPCNSPHWDQPRPQIIVVIRFRRYGQFVIPDLAGDPPHTAL
jgi:hypothetical protein